MRNGELEWGIRNAEGGMGNGELEWGMRSAEGGMRKAEGGIKTTVLLY